MYRNIALDKPCTQSSYSPWEEDRSTPSAVSGIMTSGFSFHTELEQNPWWEVDLERPEPIHGLIIWNREDDTAPRACPLHIDTSLDGQQWEPVATTHFVFGGYRSNTPLRLMLAHPRLVRFVRVSVQGEQMLHLAQVEVLQKEPVGWYGQLLQPGRPWDERDLASLGDFFTEGASSEVYPVFWQGYPHPIYLRRGTSDWANFLQVLVHQEYALPLRSSVETIVDLGAYIGLSALYFANRYPGARIICLEPSASNFQLLTLNTRCYPQIVCRYAAIWSHACTVSLARQSGGDWGNQFEEDAEGTVDACGFGDLVAAYDLERIDLLKVDIEGSEARLFDTSFEEWIPRIQAVSCELHDHMVPGCSAQYFARFRTAGFEEHQSGEYHCFIRWDS